MPEENLVRYLAEKQADKEGKDAPQTREPSGYYTAATCRLCGRVWQRDQGLARDPACDHTDAEWQSWADAQVPPIAHDMIQRWDNGVPAPPPVT